jgi:hypothetical protein
MISELNHQERSQAIASHLAAGRDFIIRWRDPKGAYEFIQNRLDGRIYWSSSDRLSVGEVIHARPHLPHGERPRVDLVCLRECEAADMVKFAEGKAVRVFSHCYEMHCD